MSGEAASRSLEVLKQISSTGYLRKRLPQELVVLQGGQGTGPPAFAAASADGAADPRPEAVQASFIGRRPRRGPHAMDARTKARMQGYEGEACGECGNYTLVRNGTCMKCNTCGSTSGCS